MRFEDVYILLTRFLVGEKCIMIYKKFPEYAEDGIVKLDFQYIALQKDERFHRIFYDNIYQHNIE